MTKLIALATFAAFASLASTAFAAADGDHPQQTRMKECNVKAKGMKGDDRKQFMSACLSGKDAAAQNATQKKPAAATPKK